MFSVVARAQNNESHNDEEKKKCGELKSLPNPAWELLKKTEWTPPP